MATIPAPADSRDPLLVSLDTVRVRTGGRSARIRETVMTGALAQLLEGGYASLTPAVVAARSGVDRATVYRRWPTRARLATDAILHFAEEAVEIPNTGTLTSDLQRFAAAVAQMLGNPATLRLLSALAAAQAEDPELKTSAGRFWRVRFDAAAEMLRRAADRGEATLPESASEALEMLVAPLYFRALVSGRLIDSELIDRCVAGTIFCLGGTREWHENDGAEARP